MFVLLLIIKIQSNLCFRGNPLFENEKKSFLKGKSPHPISFLSLKEIPVDHDDIFKNTEFNQESDQNNENYEKISIYHFMLYDPSRARFKYVVSNNPTYDDNSQIMASRALYKKTINKTGWHQLHIKTFNDPDGKVNSLLQCYSAGYVEGHSTHNEIEQYFDNIHVFLKELDDYDMKKIYQVLEEVYNSLINKIMSSTFFENLDSYELKKWSYITCLTAQLEGLFMGYNSISKNKLSIIDFILINSEGNYGDLIEVAKRQTSPLKGDFSTEDSLKKVFNTSDIIKIWKNLTKKSHCSVILKLIEDKDGIDILAGHDTWSSYSELIRTLKVYDYAFDTTSNLLNKSKKLSFSSYPGVLFSGDDFYVLDSRVTLLQTTLNVIDTFKYQDLLNFKEYIPEFIRIMSTNMMSSSGSEWVNSFSSWGNNHLYVTQWVIIDYNRLKKNDGIVYILDEVPGEIKSKDITTEFLKEKYFGSFNMPYFDSSFSTLGYDKFSIINKNNVEINPRKFILDNLKDKITDLESFEKIISYNGYHVKTFFDDPSYNDPSNGIMARNDILDNTLSGGIDYKVVNKDLVYKLGFKAKSGPTTSPTLNQFIFSKERKYMSGIPKNIKFEAILFLPID